MTIQEVADEQSKKWRSMVVALGISYAKQINKTDINFQPISKFSSIRETLNFCYATMVSAKMIQPIEKLPENEKDEYRAEARLHAAGLSTLDKMRFIKAAYCMANIIAIYL